PPSVPPSFPTRRSSDLIGNGGQHHQVPETFQKVGGEAARVVATLHHTVDEGEDRGPVARSERIHHLPEQTGVGVTQQSHRTLAGDAFLPRTRDELVQDRQAVTGRPRTGTYHQWQCRRVVGHTFLLEEVLHEFFEGARRDQPERVMVGPRTNGPDDLFGFGRGEHELQVWRRFFDEFEQRVETLPGHHVRLVDDVDLVARGDRREECAFSQIPCVVDTAVRGGVDLDDVDAAAAVGGQ